jgi:hypothetical protein
VVIMTDANTNTNIIRGACLCGAVRFEITPPTRFCGNCHCTMCRRAHAAPLVTWSGVPDGQFQITAGEELLACYASSPEATRRFCSVCGTPLLFKSTRWPGEVHVATGSLIDPPDRKPQAHVNYSDRVTWYDPEAQLPKYGGVTGMEPLE